MYFAGYRFLLAGAMIFAGVLAVGRPVTLPGRKDYALLLLVGLLQTTLQYTFLYIALALVCCGMVLTSGGAQTPALAQLGNTK